MINANMKNCGRELFMMLSEQYKLWNGVDIPKIGLGTWFINDNDVAQAVRHAVKIGYRHFDTAQAYENERGVGEAIRTCGLKRDELFVTTKLSAEVKSYDEAVVAIENSLNRMGLDYIDMMIIHSPKPWTKFQGEDHFYEGNKEVWRALEEAYGAGKLRAIGLSNFEEEDVENILKSCKVRPMVNQILAHISNTPDKLIEYCQENGILVEAHSPIAHGELMKNREVKRIASKYDVTIPQLSIRYCLQLDLLPLPKTANPEHMKNNSEVDFIISEEDMEVLRNINHISDYGDATIFPVYGGKPKQTEEKHNDSRIFPKGVKLPSEWFTGNAFITPLVAKDKNNEFSAGNVAFEPGARTNWHTHPKGQVLIVIEGRGIYQEKGKVARNIERGDVVNVPEDVEHWHGATSKTRMEHIAITNYNGDVQVTWLRPVTDEEYNEANAS